MKGYLGLTHVYLPRQCLHKAFDHLRACGEQRVEGVALFAGKLQETVFVIQETIIPGHQSYSDEDGLFYSIGGDELYRLNVMLHTTGLKLIAQIHSHPGAAFHSEADDQYAVVTKVGGLSIVVPNFAFGPVNIEACAVFRLSGQNQWMKLSPTDVKNLIKVI